VGASRERVTRGTCTFRPRRTASRQAQHFIDQNELGLSFEVIVESLLKREARPSQAVYQHLERAANEMELTASDVWLRFAKPSYE